MFKNKLSSVWSFNKILCQCNRFKSSKQWLARQIKDPYVERAKRENYRCRSAFKLIEINEKAKILAPGKVVVDLGASPGSWTQVAVEKTNSAGQDPTKLKGTVIAIDLIQIMPIEGAEILSNMDFMKTEVQDNVIKFLKNEKVDLVLSDMAPSATGVKELDKDRSVALCYMALRFALRVSKDNADLLLKVWDGKEVPVLEFDISKFYNKIKIVKPHSSRSDSSEKFILARGFKGLE